MKERVKRKTKKKDCNENVRKGKQEEKIICKI